MKRPCGVTVLTAIWAFAGTMYVLAGLQLTTSVTFGPVPTGTGVWFWTLRLAMLQAATSDEIVRPAHRSNRVDRPCVECRLTG